jgi:putative Mn2+ efflux pump MntP
MVGSLLLALLGWVLLYTAMDKQYKARAVDGRYLPPQRGLRVAGWLLLGLSLLCSIDALGATVGFAAWWVILSVTAFGFTVGRVLWSR